VYEVEKTLVLFATVNGVLMEAIADVEDLAIGAILALLAKFFLCEHTETYGKFRITAYPYSSDLPWQTTRYKPLFFFTSAALHPRKLFPKTHCERSWSDSNEHL